jgi:hypothetical protein
MLQLPAAAGVAVAEARTADGEVQSKVSLHVHCNPADGTVPMSIVLLWLISNILLNNQFC